MSNIVVVSRTGPNWGRVSFESIENVPSQKLERTSKT